MTNPDPSQPDQVLKFPIPAFDNILIEPLVEEYAGKIVIPDGIKGRPTEGRIIAIGPGRRSSDHEKPLIPIYFKPGQRVIFNEHSGYEITYNGKKYLLVSEIDVKATI